jgi:type VI secretion system protein ImpM
VSASVDPPGWHGKLPSLGDFASRRLDAAFVEAWDGWLAAGLLALREANPAGWLDAYLASPSWRFLLLPGALAGEPGRQGWAGVLMPSVDRVGRYFPFTIAQPLGDGPATTAQMGALWHWLGRLDELAGDALQEDWSVDKLEDELARMAPPALTAETVAPLPALAAAGAFEQVPLPSGGGAVGVIGREAQALWAGQAAGRGYWYAHTEVVGQRLLVSRGLPAAVGALLAVTI